MIGKYVVVRTYSAGVHVGVLQYKAGKEVTLTSSRRIWSWRGAFTLNEISQSGVSRNGSMLSVEVAAIFLTEAIEIIPCSEAAERNLRTLVAYEP